MRHLSLSRSGVTEFPTPNIRWFIVLITAVHRWLSRVTNGRTGASSGSRTFLLLTYLGCKTGRR